MASVFQRLLILAVLTQMSCLFPRTDPALMYDKPFRLVRSTCPSTFSGANPNGHIEYCFGHLSCLGSNVSKINYSILTMTMTGQFQRTVFISNTPVPQMDLSFDPNVTGWAGRYTVEGPRIQYQRLNMQGALRCIPNNCSDAVATYHLSGQGNALKFNLVWASGCQEEFQLWTQMEGPL